MIINFMYAHKREKNLYAFANTLQELGFINSKDLPTEVTELADADALTNYLVDVVDEPLPFDSPLIGEKSAILYFFSLTNGVYNLLWDGYSEVIDIPQSSQIGINETNQERRLIEDVAQIFVSHFFSN